ncbi:unnamed protein product [Ostreobium quekettii]|uniref:Carboxypeptidase Taq n=1 Tax=Ostreobium quekettii TaxID=121088 RepID=A0A8S1INU1_9CHLO|nr:unnamed protein product [Ostreobium quekettii]
MDNCEHPLTRRQEIESAAAVTELQRQVKALKRKKYEALCDRLREISRLKEVSRVLQWDQSICLPRGGGEARGKQLAAVAGIVHEKETSQEVGDLISELMEVSLEGLNDFERAVVRDAHIEWDRGNRLTKELAMARIERANQAAQKWLEAKEKNDFMIFAPSLQEMVEISKEVAATVAPGTDPYTVMVDEYERGMTAQRLGEIFRDIKEFLLALLSNNGEKGISQQRRQRREIGVSNFSGNYDVEQQEQLCRKLIDFLGFWPENGRLDVAHAATTYTLSSSDVRLVTKIASNNFSEALLATMHECGHAFYDLGLNKDYQGLPVSKPLSTGMHESQALIWEYLVGKSHEFCTWFWPMAKEFFPELQTKTADDFYRYLNTVHPSPIRVNADEVTYPLHIILRYEIERDLFAGTIHADEVPKVWNEKMQDYLGVLPKDDNEGCLQDVHWSYGCFGYFPAYALGAMYSVQLFEAAQRDVLDLKGYFRDGQFKALLDWLGKNIHSWGSLFASADLLLEEATGNPLNLQVYKAYLARKYEESLA